MIITIKDVKDSDKAGKDGKPWKIITYDKEGKELSKNIFMAEKYDLLVPGSTIEITQVQEGKYWNVTDIKPATIETAVKKEESSQYAFRYFEQIQMNRRTALMQAVQLVINGKADDLWEECEKCVNWLESGIIPQKETEAIPGPPQQATEVQSKLGEINAGVMKTLGDLMTACKAHYNMSPSTVRSLLGVKSNEDIKMSPAEAFVIIEKFQRSKK